MKSIDILLHAQHADSLHDMANKQHKRNLCLPQECIALA